MVLKEGKTAIDTNRQAGGVARASGGDRATLKFLKKLKVRKVLPWVKKNSFHYKEELVFRMLENAEKSQKEQQIHNFQNLEKSEQEGEWLPSKPNKVFRKTKKHVEMSQKKYEMTWGDSLAAGGPSNAACLQLCVLRCLPLSEPNETLRKNFNWGITIKKT